MRHFLAPFAAVVLVAVLGACSDDEKSSTVKTCCLNGDFYECSQSSEMCTESGHTCSRVASRDSECK